MENKQILQQIKEFERLVVRNTSGNWTDIKTKMKKMTPTQMEIIYYMLRNEDKNIYQKDLEQILKLRRATVSGVLQTMEKNNLITRVTSEEDSRAKRIILNENTKKVFKENKKKMVAIEGVIKSGISDKELQEFEIILNKMIKNLAENAIKNK